jgi:Mce-associated membrane protein
MTSVPPSRRRPVPTTPTTRPRVAGLRKRPETGSTPVEDAQVEDPRAEDGGTDTPVPAATSAPRAETLPSDRDITHPNEAGGLIEPREDREAETPEPARPRPTGRRKRTGEAVAPSVLAQPEPAHETSEAWVARHTADEPRSGLALPIALVVVAALLIGLGVWFQRQAGEVRYNQALVDSAGTTEVAGQAREAVEKAFSYNFADVSATEKAANELLVGKAKCQYNAIFGPVRTLAPEQKLVVTVKAVSSGVTELDGDRATVLLFLDQVTTRTTDNQSGGGIAMMRVGAQRVDGRWRVDNMEMFGQTGDQAAETAKC